MNTSLTWDEIAKMEANYSESKIQHICVQWFRKTHPDLMRNLISVPNGGFRLGRTGAVLSYEGLMPGAADLILLVPSVEAHTLCIEMKKPKAKGQREGKQSDVQMLWQEAVEKYGNVYVVCHGLLEFIRKVCSYMKDERCDELIEQARKYYHLYL